MNTILIVEDDKILREELSLFLRNNGYQTKIIEDFEHTLELIVAEDVDLLLLDINIPGVNGAYLCREIRRQSSVGIIMVTSRNSEIDELMCMSYGADDYITKPYNPQILLVRIEAVLKRMYRNDSLRLSYHDLILDVSKSRLERGKQNIELSKNETRIFHYLLKQRGRITSREEIMDYLWGSDEFVDDNTLTVNINRLRKKLSEIGYDDVIETKRGQGYLIQ